MAPGVKWFNRHGEFYAIASRGGQGSRYLRRAAIHRRLLDIRYLFAYAGSMFQGPANRKMFVVTCKRCCRDIPSGASEFPFKSVTVACCLCGEIRRYLPSELFLGKVDHLVMHQNRRPR